MAEQTSCEEDSMILAHLVRTNEADSWEQVAKVTVRGVITHPGNRPRRKKTGRDPKMARAIMLIITGLAVLFGITASISISNAQNQQAQRPGRNQHKASSQARLQFVKAGTHSFMVRNTSTVAANNVSISASLLSVYDAWLPDASDIRNFAIGISDASLLNSNHPFSYFNTHVPHARTFSGENAVKILLTALSPGEIFTVSLTPRQSLVKQQLSFSHTITVFSRSSQQIAPYKTNPQNLGQDALAAYFQEIFGTAVFDLQADCANCLDPSKTNPPASPADWVMIDSFTEINSSLVNASFLPGKILREEVKLAGTYVLPAGAQPIDLPADLTFTLGLKAPPLAETARTFLQLAGSAQGSPNQVIFVWPEYLLQACSPAHCPPVSEL